MWYDDELKRGVIVARRLTDKDRKQVLTIYAETENYRETGRILGIDDRTVRKICKETSELTQLVAKKKEENTLDMLTYMDSRKEQAQSVIDKYLTALANPEKIEKAKLVEIATALGIVVDKFTKNTSFSDDALKKLDEVLKEIGGVI